MNKLFNNLPRGKLKQGLTEEDIEELTRQKEVVKVKVELTINKLWEEFKERANITDDDTDDDDDDPEEPPAAEPPVSALPKTAAPFATNSSTQTQFRQRLDLNSNPGPSNTALSMAEAARQLTQSSSGAQQKQTLVTEHDSGSCTGDQEQQQQVPNISTVVPSVSDVVVKEEEDEDEIVEIFEFSSDCDENECECPKCSGTDFEQYHGCSYSDYEMPEDDSFDFEEEIVESSTQQMAQQANIDSNSNSSSPINFSQMVESRTQQMAQQANIDSNSNSTSPINFSQIRNTLNNKLIQSQSWTQKPDNKRYKSRSIVPLNGGFYCRRCDVHVSDGYGKRLHQTTVHGWGGARKKKNPQTTNTAGVVVQNGGAQNGGVQNGGVQNGGVKNGGIQNGGVQNGGVQNGGVQNGGVFPSFESYYQRNSQPFTQTFFQLISQPSSTPQQQPLGGSGGGSRI